MERRRTRRKIKVKKLPLIILSVVVVLLLVALWMQSSYKSGLNYAKEHGKNPQDYTFNSVIKKDAKVNVLILGQDRASDGPPRTDSIMIAQYDYLNKDMKLISVMRDIYAEIPGFQNYKINTAFTLGGPDLLRQTLQHNLGIDVEYYAVIDFKGFEAMVDQLAPNGVPVNVEKDMSEKIGVSLKKGQHNLNGKELLGYARFRNDAEGDFGRVRRQQQVMKALESEIVSISTVYKAPKLAGTARGYVDTNMTDNEIFRTGLSFVVRGEKDIKTLTVPVEDSYEAMDVFDRGNVLQIDKAKNKKAIQEFLK